MLRPHLAFLPVVLLAAPMWGDDVRDVTDANGQTWREVHRTVRHPQTETQCVDQQQTYYQEKCDVQLYDTYRTYTAPVTEYRWESYWVGRFNPFVQPYLAQRLVPRTHWETRSEIVKVPVTQRNLVPVTRTVRVPVTTEKSVDYDVVVSRQLVNPQGSALANNAAGGNSSSLAVGGVQQLNGDRPKSIVRAPGGTAAPTAVFSKPVTTTPQIAIKPDK